MLLSKEIEIKADNSTNCSILKKLGYFYSKGESILIPIEKLGLGSHKLVEVKCIKCNSVKKIRYQAYNKTTKNGKEDYYCNSKECINEKRSKSVNEKYGVDNVFKLKEVREKIESSNLKLYGVKNPHQNKDIIKKAEDTNMRLYGVKNPFSSEKIKEKIRQTNLKLYGVEYPQQSPEIRSKYSSLHKPSKVENALADYISEIYKGEIVRSSKSIIKGYELDIYLPGIMN